MQCFNCLWCFVIQFRDQIIVIDALFLSKSISVVLQIVLACRVLSLVKLLFNISSKKSFFKLKYESFSFCCLNA